jgi:hypothetical protein
MKNISSFLAGDSYSGHFKLKHFIINKISLVL